MRIDFPLLSP